MAKNAKKAGLVELPPTAVVDGTDAAEAPAAPASLPLWKVWGPYGHGEHTVAAADEDAARAEYRRLDNLLASEQIIQVKRVEASDGDGA